MEHIAWNPFQKTAWDGWKTEGGRNLQASKSSIPPSYLLALLALGIVVAETYFARKSVPLAP
jgi:hypothetical protein